MPLPSLCPRLPTPNLLMPRYCTQLAMPVLPASPRASKGRYSPRPQGGVSRLLFSARLKPGCSHPAARGQNRTLKLVGWEVGAVSSALESTGIEQGLDKSSEKTVGSSGAIRGYRAPSLPHGKQLRLGGWWLWGFLTSM